MAVSDAPLLLENEEKRLTLRFPLLLCFAMLLTWQACIWYYSGQEMTIGGGPLLTFRKITELYLGGYFLSILVLLILPHLTVWIVRIAGIVALLSTAALFLPLSHSALVTLCYVQCICCTFLTGYELAIIINLFSEKTAVKHLLLAYALAQVVIAVLHLNFVRLSFSAFQFVMIAAIAPIVLFFCKLPTNLWPRYAGKNDPLATPKAFMASAFLLAGASCFSALFGRVISANISYGTPVLYVSSAFFGIVHFALWRRFKISPLKSGSVLLAAGAIGSVFATVSLQVPAFSLVACALLGAGTACCWLVPLFGLLIARHYPSRYLAPIFIGIAFATVFIHAALFDALREEKSALYIAYLCISVILVTLYLVLEPYLGYHFPGRALQDAAETVAEETGAPETDEEEPVLENPRSEAAIPEGVSLHDQRMNILLTHALTPLTRREHQLVDCIMRGMRRSEIAQEMGVLPETVTKYTSVIYNKFGIHRRQDLFKLAE